jgi:ribosomal protein S27E
MVRPNERHETAQERHQMVTVECPWCAEPASVEGTSFTEIVCEHCSIVIEIAPEPARPLERAA